MTSVNRSNRYDYTISFHFISYQHKGYEAYLSFYDNSVKVKYLKVKINV